MLIWRGRVSTRAAMKETDCIRDAQQVQLANNQHARISLNRYEQVSRYNVLDKIVILQFEQPADAHL